MRAAGIDVAGDRIHVVVLSSGDRTPVDAFVAGTAPHEIESAVARLVALRVSRAAVDSPDAASIAHHAGDAGLSTKFRPARCGEIALGRQRSIWVAWVTPVAPGPFPAWMSSGFAVFDSLRAAGIEAVETYPHAVYRTLAGGARLPSKTTSPGLLARVTLLRDRGVDAPFLDLWGHDGLDAAAAAIVAADPDSVGITCGHDGSSIWLPSLR